MNELGQQGIILVVDDDPNSISMINSALVIEGYTVLVAMNGQQALAITEKIVPDLILLDAIMPEMDGFETCRVIKATSHLTDVPVIFMTGLSDTEDVLRGLNAGGVDYVNKPIKLDELLVRIEIHLANSRKAKGAQSALDETGQPTLACDISGKILWHTKKAQQILIQSAHEDIEFSAISEQLTHYLQAWLSHQPAKNSTNEIHLGRDSICLSYIHQSSENVFLIRLITNSELAIRNRLKTAYTVTERESEVLFWLSKGKANRDIAQILAMSPRTVNKHLEQIYRKMNVENRASAVASCNELTR